MVVKHERTSTCDVWTHHHQTTIINTIGQHWCAQVPPPCCYQVVLCTPSLVELS